MNRTFRIIKLILLLLGVLLCLAIPVVGLVSTAVNYHGLCYGFTDGQSACAWWEFARNEMFWSSFILVPLLALASAVWLTMAAVQFIVEMIQKRKDKARKAEVR
jgi:ABC-type spermidine/putrescine transport system permease subunit II